MPTYMDKGKLLKIYLETNLFELEDGSTLVDLAMSLTDQAYLNLHPNYITSMLKNCKDKGVTDAPTFEQVRDMTREQQLRLTEAEAKEIQKGTKKFHEVIGAKSPVKEEKLEYKFKVTVSSGRLPVEAGNSQKMKK